jgi:glycosyltransferase involved in cell wall biosynthesis
MIDHSIIIPTYNHLEFLPETINSVFDCDGNFEIVIVNDGSTDETARFLKTLDKIKNVRVINQTNHGAHHALNVGMSFAEGRFISILNDDDLYLKNHLEYTSDILGSGISNYIVHRAEIFGSGARFTKMKHHTEAGLILINRFGLLPTLFKFNWSLSSSAFSFNRGFFDDGLRFVNLRMTHDLDFLLSAIYRFNARCIYSDSTTWKYRVHDQGTTSSINISRQRWELAYTLVKSIMTFTPQPEYSSFIELIDLGLSVECDAVWNLLSDKNYLVNEDKFLAHLIGNNHI